MIFVSPIQVVAIEGLRQATPADVTYKCGLLGFCCGTICDTQFEQQLERRDIGAVLRLGAALA